MSTTEAASKVFEEIAQLFLSLNRTGQMDDDLKHELDQYEHAELLMRMVKAQTHARQGS
jgi:hypothetical protein